MEQAVDTRREVGAVFRSEQAFADAVFALESMGFNRASLSALGQEHSLQGCLRAAGCDMHRGPSDASSHDAILLEDDKQQARVLLTSLTATAAALLASGIALAATGGIAVPAVAAAIAGGSGGGLAQFLAWRVGKDRADRIQDQIMNGGTVLLVRVETPAREEQAISILQQHGAAQVDAHQLP